MVFDLREVEPAWLTAVLRRHDPGTPEVTAIERETIGTGQVGRCVRFHLRFADDARHQPSTVVGKFPSDDPRSLQAAKDHRNYLLEVGFYRELQSTVAVRTPRCFHHAISEDTTRFVLILEDLRGARQGDQLTGCSVDQAAAAVVQMAALHAPRWGDPSLEAVAWLEGTTPERAKLLGDLYAQVLPGFLERFGPHLDADAAAVIERLASFLHRELALDYGPQTVVHHDFRVDNLLFGDGVETPPVTVVDWQTVGRGPAAGDLAYFLGASLRASDRRANDRDLVRLYLDELRRHGVDGVEEDRLFDQYRRQSISGIVMAVVASMIVEVTERGDAMFLAMARRHAAQAIDAEVESMWREEKTAGGRGRR